jgi:hypothetical protein
MAALQGRSRLFARLQTASHAVPFAQRLTASVLNGKIGN